MQIRCIKYHGAGNDFIIIRDADGTIGRALNQLSIEALCQRRTGIGADGLILIQDHDEVDFEMVYFNSDGRLSSMCGNGGRCSAWYAYKLGIAADQHRFKAVDGIHSADCTRSTSVNLEMRPVALPETWREGHIIDTGSPHYVEFVDDLGFDLVARARTIRYSDRFKEVGVNVNYVQIREEGLAIRTYERGVEDETLACGTGVTAGALVWSSIHGHRPERVAVEARGGDLSVSFGRVSQGFFHDVWLSGPVQKVFEGTFDLNDF
ncbi:UNVERIFIED_CONTAM: hypothetical protein GTU68_058173 [Idotea baltica]|nr:hypothetical protein [Idotea baltica]